MNAWRDFKGGKWQDRIDVRDFIQKNYTPYTGDESFLQPPTARTEKMLEKYEALCRAEQQNGGVLNIDTETVIRIGREHAVVVGLVVFELLFDFIGDLVAVGFAGGAHHAHAAERVASAL